MSGNRPRSAAPPLPAELPGEFFVLERDRDRGVYVIHVDDADQSSYKLGETVETVMTRFRVWRIPELGNQAIDLANEFGACKVHPAKNLAVALFERTPKPPKRQPEDEDGTGKYIPLPSLRPAP